MYRLAGWRPSSGTFTGRRYGDRVAQERSGPDLKAAGLWGGSLLTLGRDIDLRCLGRGPGAGGLHRHRDRPRLDLDRHRGHAARRHAGVLTPPPANRPSSASLIAGRLPNTSRKPASLASRSASSPASADLLPRWTVRECAARA